VEFLSVFLGALLGSVTGWLLQVRESSRQAVIAINETALQRIADEANEMLTAVADADEDDFAFLRRRAERIDARHIAILPEVVQGERVALGKLRSDLVAALDDLRAAESRDEYFDAYDRALIKLNDSLTVLHREALLVTDVTWRSLWRRWD
jgi:hypothetical protein